jgi:hypothetical protein
MQNKIVYIALGILVGIALVILVGKLSVQEANALPGSGRPSESFGNGDFIGIATSSRSDNNLLWLVDTRDKKLLLYEYFGENAVRLKCARDIQYDIAVPDGVAIPDKGANPTPLEVKQLWDALRKNIK